MSYIKLISGMDFSGKSTIVNIINNLIPNTFIIQSKFLTPIGTIQKVKGTWLPTEIWKPLLQGIISDDIANYSGCNPILQDSLWIIKYIATKLDKNSFEDYEEIKQLKELLWQYPDMDSFYLTTTIEERVRRLNVRETSGEKLTGSDKMLLCADKFERIEKQYKDLIIRRFPNTLIIDTTGLSPEQVAQQIIRHKNFQKSFVVDF